MSDMNGVTIYAVYQEALNRIHSGRGDYRDSVIVRQWHQGIEKNAQIEELKKQIRSRDKTIGDQAAALEVFHSRENLRIMGESNVGAYLKGLLDSSQLTVH